MRVISSAPPAASGGRIPGSRRASIVLPEPGGPTISRLWPPAAAISSARRAAACPRTSARSGAAAGTAGAGGGSGGGSARPARIATASYRSCAATTGSASAWAASAALSGRHQQRLQPRPPGRLGDRDRAPPPVAGGRPGRARRPLHPRHQRRRHLAGGRQHGQRDGEVEAASLLAFAGRRQVDGDPPPGNSYEEETMPLRTRWRASWTARSAIPTTVKAGVPSAA